MDDYKKYSLEQLENWIHDALSSAEATPSEIYNTIIDVIVENRDYHKKSMIQADELLKMMRGPRPVKSDWDKWEEMHYPEEYKGSTVSSVNNTQDDGMRPWGHSDLEYMIANDILTKDRNSNFPGENAVKDKVKKWILPVEEVRDEDTDKNEYCITFPDDLLESANLKEGDQIHWIDNGDGTWTIFKKGMNFNGII